MAERIRLALLGDNKHVRGFLGENLSRLDSISVTFRGNDAHVGFKQMARNCDVILFDSPSPANVNPTKLKEKLQRQNPTKRVVFRTDLTFTDPFIADAIENGFSVVDGRRDIKDIAEAIHKAQQGEQVVLLSADSHNLDTWRTRPQR
jgi:hypothetical protein